MYQIEEPFYFYFLLVVPILFMGFLILIRWKKAIQKEYISVDLFKKLSPENSQFKPKFKLFLLSLVFIFLSIGLVNPKIGTQLKTVKREGVDIEQAKKVWDLYKANIPELEKVEIHPTPTPVKAVYDYAKDNPAHDIRAVFGKGEEERFKSLLDKEKYPHVEVFDAGVVDDFSATTLRKAIKDNDLETIEDYIPYLINVDDFLSIFQLNEAIVGDKIVCDNCGWEWKIEDGGDDLYICHKCGHDNTPNKDYLQEARYKKFLNEGWEDSKAKTINRFMDFATDYLSTERPKIKLINQEGYTQEYKSFGGYLPSEEKIFVVVHNRNMADILRTLAHEMVHHMQNADNRLNPKSGEDGSPEENEANALAGVLMRKFGRENPDIYE